MPIIYSLITIVTCFFLVRYWDKKRKKDLIKKKKEQIDWLLDLDESERIYENDDREVEYDRK